MFLLDDYFLNEKVDKKLIVSLLDFSNRYSADYLKLTITHNNTFFKREYKDADFIHLLKTTKEYSLDLYPSIWKKEFLLNLKNDWVFKEKTIWDFEGKLHKINKSDKCFIYTGKKIKFIDVIRKGKLRREAHKILMNRYNCDLSLQWPIMSKKESINDKIIPFLSMYTPRFFKKILKNIGKKKGKKYYSD